MYLLRTPTVALCLLLVFDAGNQAPPKESTPAGRVFVVHDFGTPKTVVPVSSDDAIWNQDPGLLAEAPDGMIYSTSPSGGRYLKGTIWRYDPKSGKHEVVHDFKGDTADGAGPRGGLTAGRKSDGSFDGYFYGSSYGGGKWGVGTVFRIAPGATMPEIVYSFRNGRMDRLVPPKCPTVNNCPYSPRQRADAAASYPVSAPVKAADGTIFGVASYSNNQATGVLYRIPGGEEGLSAVCIFDPRMLADRDMKQFVCHPRVSGAWNISLGNDGSTLFGTTIGGYGSIWTFPPGGGGIRVLHEFNLADGSKAVSLMQASNGNLFGTTWAGGQIGAGTVFRYATTNSSFETLSSFLSDYTLGSFAPGLNPIGGLVERFDTLNNDPARTVRSLYGSAKFGGRGGRGTIYRIGLDGSGFEVVHHFPYVWTETGRSPLGTPILHSNGTIYGTTYRGGAYDGGTLWRLTGTGLPDIPGLTSVPQYTPGYLAKDPSGKQLSDNLLTVRLGVCGYQAVDPSGKPLCAGGNAEGIKFEARNCRNPHFVQFISREEIIAAANPPQWREDTTDLGYALTTDPANPVWDVDVGRSTAADAYWDNVPGDPVVRGPAFLMNLDNPSMGPSKSTAEKLGVESDTRRATFRTYLYCNCELKRLVRWTKEKIGPAKPVYNRMSLDIPTAADQAFIDRLLQAQGFVPVP